MTLPTRALPSLIERAKISNASTMMWAITARTSDLIMSSKVWTALSRTPRPSFYCLAAPALKFGGEEPERGDA